MGRLGDLIDLMDRSSTITAGFSSNLLTKILLKIMFSVMDIQLHTNVDVRQHKCCTVVFCVSGLTVTCTKLLLTCLLTYLQRRNIKRSVLHVY
jgi:hypothetical protein